MLVLTRRLNEGLRVYDDRGRYVGRISVLGIRPDRVRLGLEVDSRFVILRDELVDSAREPAS